MQNLLIFCQYCFTWVEPHSQVCPECGVEIDLNRPDLDRESLAGLLGRPLKSLGFVQVKRPALPSFGELIGTSEGVLFVPRLHRRLNGAWEGVASSRVPGWWPFRGDHTSPRFLEWLRHPLGVKAHHETSATGFEMEPNPTALVDRLIESPGAFFVELRSIQKVTSRKRIIRLNRTSLRSIVLIDETENGSLHASLDALVRQAARAAS